jgi:hypothetical protein
LEKRVPSAADQLADLYNTHSIDLTKLEFGERRRILSILKQLEEDLVFQLKDVDPTEIPEVTYQQQRLAQLLNQARQTISGSYGGIMGTMDKDMYRLADIESLFARNSINNVTGMEIADAALTREQLRSIASDVVIQGAPSKDWWRTQRDKTRKDFEREIRLGMLQGEGIDSMVRRIRGTSTGRRRVFEDPTTGRKWTGHIFKGGIMDTSTRNAEALVRTSVAAVAAEARFQTFIENDDVVKGIQQLSMLDGRTTPICRAYSNKVWVFDKRDKERKGGSYKQNIAAIEEKLRTGFRARTTPGRLLKMAGYGAFVSIPEGLFVASVREPELWDNVVKFTKDTFEPFDFDDMAGIAAMKMPPGFKVKAPTAPGVPAVSWHPIMKLEDAIQWVEGTALERRVATLWGNQGTINQVLSGDPVMEWLTSAIPSLGWLGGLSLSLSPTAGYGEGGYLTAAIRLENPLVVDLSSSSPRALSGGRYDYPDLLALQRQVIDAVDNYETILQDHVEEILQGRSPIELPLAQREAVVEVEREIDELQRNKMGIGLQMMGYDGIILRGVDPLVGPAEQVIVFSRDQFSILEQGHKIVYNPQVRDLSRFRDIQHLRETIEDYPIYVDPHFWEQMKNDELTAIQMTELLRLHDEFEGNIHFRVELDPDWRDRIGGYSVDRRAIMFNAEYFSMPTAQFLDRSRDMSSSLFHPRFMLACHTATHEFGHALFYQLDSEVRELLSEFLRIHLRELTKFDVSEYGMRNTSELFAESFEALVCTPRPAWSPWLALFYNRLNQVINDGMMWDVDLSEIVDLRSQLGLIADVDIEVTPQAIRKPNPLGIFPNNLSVVSYLEPRYDDLYFDEDTVLTLEALYKSTHPEYSLQVPPPDSETVALAELRSKFAVHIPGGFIGAPDLRHYLPAGVRLFWEGEEIVSIKPHPDPEIAIDGYFTIGYLDPDDPGTIIWSHDTPDPADQPEIDASTDITIYYDQPVFDQELQSAYRYLSQRAEEHRLRDPIRASFALDPERAKDLLGVDEEMFRKVVEEGVVTPATAAVAELIGKEFEIPHFTNANIRYVGNAFDPTDDSSAGFHIEVLLPPGTPTIFTTPFQEAMIEVHLSIGSRPEQYEHLLLLPDMKYRVVDWSEVTHPDTGAVHYVVKVEVVQETQEIVWAPGGPWRAEYIEPQTATLLEVEDLLPSLERNQLEEIWDQLVPEEKTISYLIVEEGEEITTPDLQVMVHAQLEKMTNEQKAVTKVRIPRPVPADIRVVLPEELPPGVLTTVDYGGLKEVTDAPIPDEADEILRAQFTQEYVESFDEETRLAIVSYAVDGQVFEDDLARALLPLEESTPAFRGMGIEKFLDSLDIDVWEAPLSSILPKLLGLRFEEGRFVSYSGAINIGLTFAEDEAAEELLHQVVPEEIPVLITTTLPKGTKVVYTDAFRGSSMDEIFEGATDVHGEFGPENEIALDPGHLFEIQNLYWAELPGMEKTLVVETKAVPRVDKVLEDRGKPDIGIEAAAVKWRNPVTGKDVVATGTTHNEAFDNLMASFPKDSKEWKLLDQLDQGFGDIESVEVGLFKLTDGSIVTRPEWTDIQAGRTFSKVVSAVVEYKDPETGVTEYFDGPTHADAFVELLAVHPDVDLDAIPEERIAWGGLFRLEDGSIITSDQLKPIEGVERITAEALARAGFIQVTERGVIVEKRVSAIVKYEPTGEIFEAATHIEARDLLEEKYPDFDPPDLSMDLIRLEDGSIVSADELARAYFEEFEPERTHAVLYYKGRYYIAGTHEVALKDLFADFPDLEDAYWEAGQSIVVLEEAGVNQQLALFDDGTIKGAPSIDFPGIEDPKKMYVTEFTPSKEDLQKALGAEGPNYIEVPVEEAIKEVGAPLLRTWADMGRLAAVVRYQGIYYVALEHTSAFELIFEKFPGKKKDWMEKGLLVRERYEGDVDIEPDLVLLSNGSIVDYMESREVAKIVDLDDSEIVYEDPGFVYTLEDAQPTVSTVVIYKPTGEVFEGPTHMQARQAVGEKYPDFDPEDVSMGLVRLQDGSIVTREGWVPPADLADAIAEDALERLEPDLVTPPVVRPATTMPTTTSNGREKAPTSSGSWSTKECLSSMLG